MSNGQHQSLFQPDLLQSETIEWSGQPETSVNFNRTDIFLIPFSLLWGGFALFALVALIFSWFAGTREAESIIGYLVGIFMIVFFAIIGVYLIVGRFAYKKWQKRRTHYALTNKRALVLSLSFGRKIQGIFLDRLPTINKSVRHNGIGTIYFGSPSWITAIYGNSGLDFMSGFYSTDIPAFCDIKDADKVYDLANRLR